MAKVKKVEGKEDSVKEKREKVIFIRVTKEEYEKINELAEYANMTVSKYLIARGLKEKVKWRKNKRTKGEEREKLEELMWQLKKLGRNVNQLAHSYEDNKLTGESLISQKEINLVGEKIKGLLKELEEGL